MPGSYCPHKVLGFSSHNPSSTLITCSSYLISTPPQVHSASSCAGGGGGGTALALFSLLRTILDPALTLNTEYGSPLLCSATMVYMSNPETDRARS